MTATSSLESPILSLKDLRKTFSDFWGRSRVVAIDGLDLEIKKGEVFGLLGPNGSGKTTTLKVVLGLLFPTSGEVSILGANPQEVKTRSQLGYLPEESYLHPFLTPPETLDFYARLFSIPSAERRKRIRDLLNMVGLDHVSHRRVKELSKGMQRRLGLAQALINNPSLLILDEPTSGLDPLGTRQVKDLILDLKNSGKTIILSSHLLADVESVCDRISLLYGGKKLAEGDCDQLLVNSQGQAISLEEFFLKEVEKARSEGLSTSGAQKEGQLPQFLHSEENSSTLQGKASSGGATS